MTWEFHPARTMFAKYAGDWDRLNLELYNAHPYFDSRFIGPLLDNFATSKELLCLYRSNDVIEGALILQQNGVGHWAFFHPSQAQITPVLIGGTGILAALMYSLPGFAWRVELFAIDPRYAPDFQKLALPLIVDPYVSTIGIQLERDFQDYWRERRAIEKNFFKVRIFAKLGEENLPDPFVSTT